MTDDKDLEKAREVYDDLINGSLYAKDRVAIIAAALKEARREQREKDEEIVKKVCKCYWGCAHNLDQAIKEQDDE